VVQESGTGRSGGRSNGDEWRRGVVEEETVTNICSGTEEHRRSAWPRRRGTMLPRRWD
jgi:hypothetical protein